MSRRKAIQGLVAAGLAGGVGAEAPAQPEGAISPEDLAVVGRLTGEAFPREQRELMAQRAARVWQEVRGLREHPLEDCAPPAFHFDPRLPGMSFPQGKSSVRVSSGRPPAYSGKPEDLAFASVVELSRLIRARQVTSTALTQMYLDRLKRYGPRLNCVVTLTEDLALEQAERADRELAEGRDRGPLHGIPWGAKDLLSVRGYPTTWGIRPYERRILDTDATVVERLEEAGAVLVAKLSLGELAMGDVWFGGLTRNPWEPGEGSSGSSAGSASAVAAGLVGFALGSETLGSIVSPSVTCGVAGLRPTFGRVSRHGAMALSWTMDKLGPLARGVEDCALVLGALHGPDGRDETVADVPFRWNPRSPLRELRVGLDSRAFEEIRKDEARAPVYEEALKVLRGLGIEPRPIELPDRASYGAIAWLVIDVEASASFTNLRRSGGLERLEQQEEGSWPNVLRTATALSAVDYLRAQQVRRDLQREMARVLGDLDLFITVPFAGPCLSITNLTGHPSLVLRCGAVEGKPQSLELIGGLYREAEILRVGLAFERATPWHTQWPDLSGLA